MNMSLTLHSDQPALEQAISVLAEEGILLVAAAGNQDGPVLWPAAYPGALAVAATDREDLRAEYSNVGPEVDMSLRPAMPFSQPTAMAAMSGWTARAWRRPTWQHWPDCWPAFAPIFPEPIWRKSSK